MTVRRWLAPGLAIALGVSALGLTGCASGGFFSGGFLPTSSTAEEQPWQIPDDAFPTQRLFRIRYDGPEGELSFRLTLYLESRSNFRMDASDTLGRKVWSLVVEDDGQGLWLNHREDLYCRIESAANQSFVPVAYLPLVHLPRLVLGRMPADPADDLRRAEGLVSYVDRGGQLWSGRLDDEGRVRWWSLVENGVAVAWWRLDEEGGEGSQVFVDSRRDQEVRWVEQVRETLATGVPAAEIPRSYDTVDCSSYPESTADRSDSGATQDVEDRFLHLRRGDG